MARSSPKKSSLPFKETNGALASSSATPKVTPTAAPSVSPSRSTHGGYIPLSSAEQYTSAEQLLRRTSNIARGTIGSFETLAAYTTYLNSLNSADLHRHAVDEAHIVAIDDRKRLIKRLEQEWSGVRAKEAVAGPRGHIPPRPGFTQEQREAQEAIKVKLLKGRVG